jgi:hypothetical protein
MRAPIFGLSTTPIADLKSEVRLQLERDLLALYYQDARYGGRIAPASAARS